MRHGARTRRWGLRTGCHGESGPAHEERVHQRNLAAARQIGRGAEQDHPVTAARALAHKQQQAHPACLVEHRALRADIGQRRCEDVTAAARLGLGHDDIHLKRGALQQLHVQCPSSE